MHARIDATYRLSYAIVGDEADARDSTQEAFIAAWRRIGELRDPARFDAWLQRIAVNAARMTLRARGRRRVREIPSGDVATLAACLIKRSPSARIPTCSAQRSPGYRWTSERSSSSTTSKVRASPRWPRSSRSPLARSSRDCTPLEGRSWLRWPRRPEADDPTRLGRRTTRRRIPRRLRPSRTTDRGPCGPRRHRRHHPGSNSPLRPSPGAESRGGGGRGPPGRVGRSRLRRHRAPGRRPVTAVRPLRDRNLICGCVTRGSRGPTDVHPGARGALGQRGPGDPQRRRRQPGDRGPRLVHAAHASQLRAGANRPAGQPGATALPRRAHVADGGSGVARPPERQPDGRYQSARPRPQPRPRRDRLVVVAGPAGTGRRRRLDTGACGLHRPLRRPPGRPLPGSRGRRLSRPVRRRFRSRWSMVRLCRAA